MKPIRVTAHMWRTRKRDGLSADEKQEFEKWYEADPAHAAAYAEALLLWEATGLPGYADDLKATLDETKEPLTEAQSLPNTTYSPNPWTAHIFAGVTAIAALVVAAIFVGSPDAWFSDDSMQTQRFAAEDGQTKNITLPDQTRITLGAGAVIEIALTEDRRDTRLIAGDAFFRVTPNEKRPFVITTDQAEVLVTGTAFDLQLDNDALLVAVAKGSVRVAREGLEKDGAVNDQLDLAAGQAVKVSAVDGFSELSEVFPGEIAAWRTGMLIYRDTPLSEVVADLNRYSAKTVTIDPLIEGLTLNGTFSAKNLDFTFEAMERSLPVRVRHGAEQVRIEPR